MPRAALRNACRMRKAANRMRMADKRKLIGTIAIVRVCAVKQRKEQWLIQ